MSLVFNPRARLVPEIEAGRVTAVNVSSPVRGRPLRDARVEPRRSPAIFDFLARFFDGSGAVEAELDEDERNDLAALGLLVPARDVPKPVRYRCSPLEARGPRPSEPALLRVTRDLAPLGDVEAPLEAGCAWVSVKHADVPLPSVYSLDAALAARLIPGESPPADLSPSALAALAAAGVLVDPAQHASRKRAAGRARAEEARALAQDRWVVVRGLLHPVERAAMARYYRELIAQGYLPLGDTQVSRRYHAHNEPLARSLHRRLVPLVSKLAGERMKPSYVYFASYRGGSVLKRHRDRAQCELSISLLLDYQPSPRGPSPWPLFVQNAGRRGFTAVQQAPGDALFYRGCELTHYRDALPEDHASTSMFLHYVPASFDGDLD